MLFFSLFSNLVAVREEKGIWGVTDLPVNDRGTEVLSLQVKVAL